MSGERIRVKRIHPAAVMPKKATSGSAGWDLHAVSDAEIPSKGWSMVGTGLVIELPPNMEAQVRSRSGMALKRGIFVINAPGTIDPDYRGEVRVILANLSDGTQSISAGDRIAQMVFSRIERVSFVESREVNGTDRGKGGFGSTGD